MKILITGFPYIRKEYRDTFKEYPKEDRIFFLLPKHWPIKKGAVVFDAPSEQGIISTRTFFSHSNYPVIGGLLKGWMPAFPLVLFNRISRIDLVYVCSEPILLSTLYSALWAKILGKKVALFSWENIPYENKFHKVSLLVHSFILRLSLSLCDGIICGNKKGAEIFHKYTRKPITIIPMSGADSNFFHRQQGAKIFHGEDWTNKLIFTFAGAISYRKGIHLIIEVFPEVLKQVSSAHLVIAGSGEYEENLKAKIGELGLTDYITLIPWLSRNGLRELLSVSDVFLYPSISHGGWEEQFGYSMAEASLMELPIIATKTGSIEEVVVDEKTGILVEANNSVKIKNAMIRLGSDADLRRRLGQAGRNYIGSNFSHQIIANKFHDFFTKIIGN